MKLHLDHKSIAIIAVFLAMIFHQWIYYCLLSITILDSVFGKNRNICNPTDKKLIPSEMTKN